MYGIYTVHIGVYREGLFRMDNVTYDKNYSLNN